jgi:hypothetical protein
LLKLIRHLNNDLKRRVNVYGYRRLTVNAVLFNFVQTGKSAAKVGIERGGTFARSNQAIGWMIASRRGGINRLRLLAAECFYDRVRVGMISPSVGIPRDAAGGNGPNRRCGAYRRLLINTAERLPKGCGSPRFRAD